LNVLTATLAAAFLILCVAGLTWGARRAEQCVIVAGLTVTTGILFATSYSAHLYTGRFPGIQGRYLFGLLVPVAILLALGLDRLRRLLRRRAPWSPRFMALAGVLVSVLGVALAFRIFYVVDDRPDGAALALFRAWSPWSPRVLGALVGSLLGSVLVLALVMTRAGDAARRTPRKGTEVTQTP
jgi:hypothetical protein